MRLPLITILYSILFCSCNSEKSTKSTVSNQGKASPVSQRQLHEETFGDLNLSTEQQWDSLNNSSHQSIIHNKEIRDSNYRTFGWHIYSNGSSHKTYNFSMLWGISYFSYSVLPETGGYKSIHQWKTTSLIDSAKAYGCKTFLSVSNFGGENNATFLENPKAQNTLIDSLISLLAYRQANGINIDFEGISKKNKEDFTKFIELISTKLKQENPDYMVSLCLYAVDWNSIFDIKVLNPYIDFYTLMGYDYYGSFSKLAGPVTPFKTSEIFGKGLESSVDSYINKGLPPKKLIVGLPYYGAEWYTQDQNIPSKVKKFRSHPTYSAIQKVYRDSLAIPLQFGSNSSSSYMTIKDNDSTYRQIWFEDSLSLAIKYDWIKEQKIGGVGIWALGYDSGYSELWDLLALKFSKE